MSRNAFKPNDVQRKAVELMAGFGIPHDDICLAVIHVETGRPITKKTLAKHFRAELDEGRSRVKLKVMTTLMYRAQHDQSPAAAIFLGKSVLGLREKDPDEGGNEITIKGGLPEKK